jgi:hypothetical protein
MDIQLEPIRDIYYLKKLIDAGYAIVGPRHNKDRDLAALKAMLQKGHEFAPEEWLSSNKYQFIEPNTFTKGYRISYKLIDDFPDERFKSNYSLLIGEKQIPLYLQVEVKQVNE